jgi:hypothetical protein
MTSENMKQAYEIVSKLSLGELTELSSVIDNALIEKRQKFQQLVMTLEETLNEIFDNYPNAKLPLVVSPTEEVDIMDLIIPQDFANRCEMGD